MKNCEECGAEFEPERYNAQRQRFCSRKCQLRNYERGRNKRYVLARQKLIVLLGNRCVACGTRDKYLLTIDHINNDRDGRKNNNAFCQKMLKQPDEAKKKLQVLCWNDNAMKQFHPEIFYSRFPHLKKNQTP